MNKISRAVKPTSVTQAFWQNTLIMPDGCASLVENKGRKARNFAQKVFQASLLPEKRSENKGTVPITWREQGHAVAEVCLRLKDLGIQPGMRVVIIGFDSFEWAVIERAIASIGAICAPINYPRITLAEVTHILNDSQPALITYESSKALALVERQSLQAEWSKDLQFVSFKELHARVPDFRNTPVGPEVPQPPCFFLPSTVDEFQRLQQLFTTPGAQLPFEPEDLNTLIYTSGSTSLPKGVMISHDNTIAMCENLMGLGYDFGPGDTMMHYLPFGHVLAEKNGKDYCQYLGVSNAYSTPFELERTLPLYRPNALLGVPRVWNGIMDKTLNRAKGNGFSAIALRWALRQSGGLGGWLAAKTVFPMVLGKMGMNKVRITVSGSAAIPKETLKFLHTIGLSPVEGYGTTETLGGIFGNTFEKCKFGSLGMPGPGVQPKLVPRPGIDPAGTGVLWVRGRMITKGYWRNPEKTAQAFDSEGYYCTGDVVRKDEDGFYWFVGREGRLGKKLEFGEFYSEELIQTEVEKSSLFLAAVITGENRACVGALVYLNQAKAKEIVGAAPAGVNALEYYNRQPAVQAAIQAEIDAANARLAAAKAKDLERVTIWTAIPIDAADETNEVIGSSGKTKNEVQLKRQAKVIDEMYEKYKLAKRR